MSINAVVSNYVGVKECSKCGELRNFDEVKKEYIKVISDTFYSMKPLVGMEF